MYLFILIYHLEDSKRLVTQLQGNLQGRCVVWIGSWALRIHCNPRAPLSANHLISKGWIEIGNTVLQRIYVIWYRFVSWVKDLLDILKLWNLLSLDPIFPKTKSICFWFQAMKNDWVWRKVFERFVNVLNVLVDIIRVLFFQLVSVIKMLDSKFESFLAVELKYLTTI